VIIQQIIAHHTQRLSHEAETDPEEPVTKLWTPHKLIQFLLHDHDRGLYNENKGGNSSYKAQGRANPELMKESRDQEYNHNSHIFMDFLSNAGVVDMSCKEIVGRDVPASPILVQISAIPPFLVEFSVTIAGDFAVDIEQKVENEEEEQDPKDCAWNWEMDIGLNNFHNIAFLDYFWAFLQYRLEVISTYIGHEGNPEH